jgi:hypothetical protein
MAGAAYTQMIQSSAYPTNTAERVNGTLYFMNVFGFPV